MSLYESNEETFAAASSDLDELLEASLTAQGLKAKDVLHYTLYAFYAKMTDGVLTPLAGYEAGSRSYAVMTAAEYNENFGTQVQLERSQLLYKMNEGSLREDMLTLADKRYAVVGKAKELVLRGADAADLSDVVYLVVSDQNEFARIMTYLQQSDAGHGFRMICSRAFDLTDAAGNALTDAQITEAVERVMDEFRDPVSGGSSRAIGTYGGNQPVYTSMDFSCRTRGSAMETFTNLYGGLFFLGILLSLAFLGATVMIMYYKQITEGYDDKERFHILRDVGMSDREIRRSIRDQVRKVFFIPLLGAGLHIAFAFHIIKLMIKVFGISNTSLLIYTTLASFLLFAAFYIVVYLITSRAYYKIVAVEQ